MNEIEISNKTKSPNHKKVENYSTFEDFNENTHRVRRNLLIFSTIALFYKLSGAILSGKFSFLGLEFDHINTKMIDIFLLCIVIYHLIHFAWLAIEHYKYNIVGLTRVGNKFHRDTLATGINLQDNSWNLYMWWNENKHIREEVKNHIDTIYKPIQELSDCIKPVSKEELEFRINAFEGLLKAFETRLEDNITPHLKKFNDSYKNYSLINRLRWMILEIGIPFAIGLSAIIYLYFKS